MKAPAGHVTQQNLATYDTAWSVAEYTREQGLRPLEAELIEEFFPRPPVGVLDLGCGAGRTTIGLARQGYQAVGIDLSVTLLAQARQRYPQIEFRVMDATRLQFADASFAAALFSYNGIDCIYPAAARRRCLAEVFRVLAPGGIFLLSSHNLIGSVFSGGYWYPRGYWNAAKLFARQWRNSLAREWYIRYEDGGGPQFLYSAPPGYTVRQLEDVGFSVVAVRGVNGERRRAAIRMHQQHVHFVARKP
jgi:ubiquinone/menaquinone biosynthesis C-methylase UbiE